jgi:hypothetical protein
MYLSMIFNKEAFENPRGGALDLDRKEACQQPQRFDGGISGANRLLRSSRSPVLR